MRGTFSTIAHYTIVARLLTGRNPGTHKRAKHIERKYHLIRDIVHRGDVVVTKIALTDNLADLFMKSLPAKTFDSHLEGIEFRCIKA